MQGTATTGNQTSGITVELLEKSERSKMRQRNNLNKEILKILLKKQETEKMLKEKKELLRDLQSLAVVFK